MGLLALLGLSQKPKKSLIIRKTYRINAASESGHKIERVAIYSVEKFIDEDDSVKSVSWREVNSEEAGTENRFLGERGRIKPVQNANRIMQLVSRRDYEILQDIKQGRALVDNQEYLAKLFDKNKPESEEAGSVLLELVRISGFLDYKTIGFYRF